jgi:two-component system CheB/CheR fusion protein
MSKSKRKISSQPETAKAAPRKAPRKVRPGPSLETSFPIVGIGASAGGLAAFEQFFAAMPSGTDPGVAFILVQHLAPDHKSLLTELVKRYTPMEVFEVEDGMVVRPNCAYIIPPNRDMALLNGTLQLLPQSATRGLRLPIDFFFRSLAQDQHERAICIVLSGTGSDGTMGVRAIKSAGGMVMVQNPESTEYDGMPQSAIATGLVDYILPPSEMPARLLAYTSQVYGKLFPKALSPAEKMGDSLKKIFALLRIQTGHDFSHYKESTIVRRIQRRMVVHQIEHLEGYVAYLQKTPSELEALFLDFLIGVTNFFRDHEAFEALREQVIPVLFSGKSAGASIRVWVPGCSTGEEAYSIAILIQEHMAKLNQVFKVQVFATDIDRRAVDQARGGLYPASIASDISHERLARYFVLEPDGSAYRIHKNIRDLLVFSEHDLIKDPPFSRLDLVSCRNLLIYMDGVLQKRIIPLFHYALNPGGFLFLGTSESVGDFVDIFVALDRKAKLYQTKEGVRATHGQTFGAFLQPVSDQRVAPQEPGKGGDAKLPLRELTERTLLQQYAPVGALITEQGEILYLHGRSGLYLEPAAGEPVMNILEMAREGLRRELTIALHRAISYRQPVQHLGLRVKTNGHFTLVNLTVRPVVTELEASSDSLLFLVILEKVTEPPSATAPVSVTDGKTGEVDARILELKKELQLKEDYLQSTNEELETSNEELKSSNEEMQSVNEELQSTNEELETSKEELQSVNEELSTVNSELQIKVADLSRANNDMNNLLAGTGMGTIFVDLQQHIQRFTPAITQVINLIPTDVGRPVGHIVPNLVGYDHLVEDVQSVLDTLVPREVEVKTKAGAWYLLGIRPYRTLENVIEGAVITFVNITEMKNARGVILDSEALRRLAAVVMDSRDAITVQDLKGRILAWNPGAQRLYGWSEAEALQMNLRDLVPEGWKEEVLKILEQHSREDGLEPCRMQRLAKEGRTMEVWVTATALVDEARNAYAIVTTERPAREKIHG